MTQYYLDEDWNLIQTPATNADVSGWANEYQQRYFPEPKNVDIAVLGSLRGTACFFPEKRLIAISKEIAPFHSLTRIALLHEMIHVKLYGENGDADENHGARFKGEIRRLIGAGAYEGLL